MKKHSNPRLNITLLSLWASVSQVLSWIRASFHLQGLGHDEKYLDLCHRLESIQKDRGSVASMLYAKKLRGALMNYLSGNPLRFDGIRYTRDGIPLALGFLADELRRGEIPAAKLQFLNTILYSPRSLKLGKEPDFTPVSAAPNFVRGVANIAMWAGSFWAELGYFATGDVPKAARWRQFHFTTKSGPNGHALKSFVDDLESLPDSLVQSLKIVGGSDFSNVLETLLSGINVFRGFNLFHKPAPNMWIRKLSYFPDKELKVRVIAQLDYFSQTVLKPLHEYLFAVLRKIPQDQTYDQGGFRKALEGAEIYYSIDLSNATDRFPIDLIAQVLNSRFPASYVEAWKDVMVGYPFKYYPYGSKVSQEISYAVGNPMGAYSSWSSFALTHHYLIYYCSRICNKDWKTLPYALLGDDIVIGNKEVAEAYLNVLSDLGVGVARDKTHVSPNLYEFAKRIIYKDAEISPFPISGLKEVQKANHLLCNLLITLEKKGWITKEGIPKAVSAFKQRFSHYPSRLAKKVMLETSFCESIMRIMEGAEAADELNKLVGHLGLPLSPPIQKGEAPNILENIAVDRFADASEELSRPGSRPLGDLATDFVIYLTGLGDLGCSLITNPLLQSYGLIEEMYMNLVREGVHIAMTGGKWPLSMRTLAIPLDDRVFVERSSRQLLRVAPIFSKKLQESFKVLMMYPNLRVLDEVGK